MRAAVAPSRRKHAVHANIVDNVEPGSKLYTVQRPSPDMPFSTVSLPGLQRHSRELEGHRTICLLTILLSIGLARRRDSHRQTSGGRTMELDRGDIGTSVEAERNVQLLSERRSQLFEGRIIGSGKKAANRLGKTNWDCASPSLRAALRSSRNLPFVKPASGFRLGLTAPNVEINQHFRQ